MVAVWSALTVPSASTVTSTLPVEAATARTGIGRPASAPLPPGALADGLKCFLGEAVTATTPTAATATPRGESDKLTQVRASWATHQPKKCNALCVSGQLGPCSGPNVYRSASC